MNSNYGSSIIPLSAKMFNHLNFSEKGTLTIDHQDVTIVKLLGRIHDPLRNKDTNVISFSFTDGSDLKFITCQLWHTDSQPFTLVQQMMNEKTWNNHMFLIFGYCKRSSNDSEFYLHVMNMKKLENSAFVQYPLFKCEIILAHKQRQRALKTETSVDRTEAFASAFNSPTVSSSKATVSPAYDTPTPSLPNKKPRVDPFKSPFTFGGVFAPASEIHS